VTAHLLWLQLPFLYLPMLIIGLAIYGADFEHPSGRIYIWTPFVLAVLHFVLRTWGRVFARREVAAPLLLVCAALIAFAYRPLHMDWWDERSTLQALRILAIGACSVFASHVGALRVQLEGGPRSTHAASAFGVLALFAVAGMLYPLLPLLTLAPLLATGAATASTLCEDHRSFRPVARFGGWHRFALLLVAIEFSLPLWDFQTDPRWALFFGLGLVGAGVGVFWARRSPLSAVALPAFAICMVAVSALDSTWVVCPTRAVVIGAAAGWLCYPLLDAPPKGDRAAQLSWCTPLWIFGLSLGFVLSANRAFLGLRLILWLPLLFPLIALIRGSAERPGRRSAA
jgi:hypothetical protein